MASASESSGVFQRTWEKGPVFFAVTVALALLLWAVFIHVSASITKLEHRSFGRAFRAAIVSWILGLFLPFVLGFLFGLFQVTSQSAITAVSAACLVLPGTLAIRNCYEAGFLVSLITYLIALVVMCAVMIGVGLALGVAGA